MTGIQSLISALHNYLVITNVTDNSRYPTDRTELIHEHKRLYADRIYIGKTTDYVINHCEYTAEPHALLLLAEMPSRSMLPEFPQGLDYAVFSCSQAMLYNTLSNINAEQNYTVNSFAKFIEKLLLHKYQSSQEISLDFEHLPYQVKKFVRFAVVRKRHTDTAFLGEKLANELKEFFPRNNITVWGEEIILLVDHDERAFEPYDKHDAKLTDFLIKNDAFLMYSNATRDISTLASIYTLTERTLDLAIKLKRDDSSRIFYYEDYCNYYILDMAIQGFLSETGSGDLLHLVHPAAVALTRYDRKYRSDLRDVLYQYLVNDRNLVKTAEKTFLHRNTVINKVNKVKQIIGLDLDDAKFRQRLIFSIQFLRYYEEILNMTVRD